MRSYLIRSENEPESLLQARQRTLTAEAARFAFELMVILMAASDSAPETTAFCRDKLALVLGGDDDAFVGNPLARNTQFELFGPALLKIAGFDIRAGRADADWHLSDEVLTLEAKRVNSSSYDAISKRIREAASKIRGQASSGLIQVVQSRGLILLNVDVQLADISYHPRDEELNSLMQTRLQPVMGAIDRVSHNYAVLGLLVFGHTRCWQNLDSPPVPHLIVSYPTAFISMLGQDPGEVSMSARLNRAMQTVQAKVIAIAHSVPSWD